MENKLYQAKATALPFREDPIGELYEDMYIDPIENSNGENKNHLVQSGKFYIREYFLLNNVYNDIMIDPESLVDVTEDYGDAIFVGCDLSKDLDITYLNNGEYYVRKD